MGIAREIDLRSDPQPVDDATSGREMSAVKRLMFMSISAVKVIRYPETRGAARIKIPGALVCCNSGIKSGFSRSGLEHACV
jgi:hypothetical protein